MKYSIQLFITSFFTLLLTTVCFSQNVNLNSQADVNAFNPSTVSISGNLIIQESNGSTDPIVNLSNLSNLISITGNLWIKNNNDLQHLDDFSNLTSIGGYLLIDNNDSLQHINGLSNITSISGYLSIKGNNSLQHIEGLINLVSIAGYLLIDNNDSLPHINGLLNLASIGGNLIINNNDFLQHIDGLINLTSINANLKIKYNISLQNIDGLANITSIDGYLYLRLNFSLQRINGLANLTSIGGNLHIENNDSLQHLDGLANLPSIGGYLNIDNNGSLQHIDGLANLTSIGGDLYIGENVPLQNIDGLANLTSIGGYLHIFLNSFLQNIDGLSNITSISGYVKIWSNNSLQNIDGLANLTSIGQNFWIHGNDVLPHIDGLANLTSIGGDLRIESNAALKDCCGIKDLINDPNGVAGSIIFFNSPFECNNVNVIQTTCSIYIYVDINAIGSNNGDSWTNAFTDLQDALSIAQVADTIHIAEGTYLPSLNGTRGESFDIPTEITLLGGYPTGGGLRNPDLYETILSGNVDNNVSIQGDSYHVITIKDAVDVEINGITIRDGNADNPASYARSRGGGLYINNSTVELTDVEIKWNRAVLGGAVFAKFSDITINQSTFKKNRADYGAAFYYSNASNLNLHQTHVINNTSNIRCALESNNASNTLIENCIFANNKSSNANALGFIATNRDASAQITNSTILGENADKNLISVQVGNNDQMNLTINNSIVAHQDPTFDKNIVVYNNNVFNFNRNNSYFSGAGITGNGANNLFASTAGDLQLNGDYSLANSSPAVNAGDDALAVGLNDIFGHSRFVGIVDIGAVENQMAPRYIAKNQEKLINKKSTFNIFPNPTSNSVSVDLGKNHQEVNFTLRNILGQIIFQKSINNINQFHFEINGITGLYLLEIETKEGDLTTFKILKK